MPFAHDIIVIGASAGGIEALPKILGGLPEDLPAALFVVVHVSPSSPGMLPRILNRCSPLPVGHGEDGEKIKRGRVYVAPPDCHMLLSRGKITLSHGPKVNRHRPAIDPLFRSAAQAFGSRVVGVILTGALDDGALGLQTVKEHGGLAFVQDPKDALVSSMPEAALRYVNVDQVLRLDDIPAALLAACRLRTQSSPTTIDGYPSRALNDQAMTPKEKESRRGPPSAFICPECNGPLWELNHGKLKQFECLVGHAYSPENLLDAESEALERALWVAVKTLEERASLLRHLATDVYHAHERPLSSARFKESSLECEQNAEVIRGILRTRNTGSRQQDSRPRAGLPKR